MELFSFVEAREDMKLSDLQKQLETKRGMKRMNERREEGGERREERGEIVCVFRGYEFVPTLCERQSHTLRFRI